MFNNTTTAKIKTQFFGMTLGRFKPKHLHWKLISKGATSP